MKSNSFLEAVIVLKEKIKEDGLSFYTQIKHSEGDEFQNFWCQFIRDSPGEDIEICTGLFTTHDYLLREQVANLSHDSAYLLMPDVDDEPSEHAVFGKVAILNDLTIKRLLLSKRLEKEALEENRISTLNWQIKIDDYNSRGFVKKRVDFVIDQPNFNVTDVEIFVTEFKSKGLSIFDEKEKYYKKILD